MGAVKVGTSLLPPLGKSSHGDDAHGTVVTPGIGVRIADMGKIKPVFPVTAGSPTGILCCFPGTKNIQGFIVPEFGPTA